MTAKIDEMPEAEGSGPGIEVHRESIYIWPGITPEEGESLRAEIFREPDFPEDCQPQHFSDRLEDHTRSTVIIPFVGLDPGASREPLLGYVERVAQQTNRRQMRFGWRKEGLLLGFDVRLSESDIKAFEESDIKEAVGVDLSDPIINPDNTATYVTAKPSMRDLIQGAFQFVAPEVAGGVVACQATVKVVRDSPTLFGKANDTAAEESAEGTNT